MSKCGLDILGELWHVSGNDSGICCEHGIFIFPRIASLTLSRRIVADHNACLDFEDPETTVPELVALAKRVSDTCSWGVRCSKTDPCLSCAGHAVLAKTGKKPAASSGDSAGK